MRYSDTISLTALKSGTTKVAARKVVDSLLELIVESLKNGEPVSLTGLGKFKTHTKPARLARNPKTGEPVQVAEHRVVRFSPKRDLKYF